MCSYNNLKVLCETCNFMLQSPSHWGEGRRSSDAACAACAEPAEVSLPK